jgi:hypothetical protein
MRNFGALLATTAALSLVACLRDEPDIVGIDESHGSTGVAIVSDAVVSASPSPSTMRDGPALAAPSDHSSVVYVSLPPGVFPDGSEAVVANLGSGSRDVIALVDGGFDPVAVSASAGTTMAFEVFKGTTRIAEWREIVPPDRPPIVVRTYPPKGKRDVPVTSSLLVVFSEPMDSTILERGAIELMRGRWPIRARLEFLGPDRLTARLVPEEPLTRGTLYRIIVNRGLRDLEQDALETQLEVDFTTASADIATGPSRIAFGNAGDIWVMNADGSGTRSLTASNEVYDANPAWSPDGSKIAFDRQIQATQSPELSGTIDVWVMNADGSGQRRLTATGRAHGPTWSPDGSRIAFVDDNRDIYALNTDGSGLTKLTNEASGVSIYGPDWSPDGSRIAFACVSEY